MTTSFATPNSSNIHSFFSSITDRYDLINTILSFGLDAYWRQKAVTLSLKGTESSILDVGTGTGKFLQTFLKRHSFQQVCAIDLCESMLFQAKAKVHYPVNWFGVNVTDGIPFKSNQFDIVTAAFTLRSISDDLDLFFRDVYRVLNTDGKATFLELTRPNHLILKGLHSIYLKAYLPLVGMLFSNSKEAYHFLAKSILNFDEPERIKQRLLKVGFSKVNIVSMSGGIVTLIEGIK